MTENGRTKQSIQLHSATDHSVPTTMTTLHLSSGKRSEGNHCHMVHPALQEGKHEARWEHPLGLYPR